MAITRLHPKSCFHCNDNLLFILQELTGHSTTQIMGRFLDATLAAVNCPPNLKDVMAHFDISVIRAFYPGTPIMYKLTVFVDKERGVKPEPLVVAHIAMVHKTTHKIEKLYSELVEEISRDLLINDESEYRPKRPRAMNPRGIKSQSYKRRF